MAHPEPTTAICEDPDESHVHLYTGTVTSLSDTTFEAELCGRFEGGLHFLDLSIPLQSLHPEDAAQVELGSWVVLDLNMPGRSVRIYANVPPSPEEVAKQAALLRSAFGVEDDVLPIPNLHPSSAL